jgi:GINS complex subunit 3
LKAGTKLELPFWLAQYLARREHVQIDLPNVFGTRFKATLLADATVVNLAERCPFYYELGIKFADL